MPPGAAQASSTFMPGRGLHSQRGEHGTFALNGKIAVSVAVQPRQVARRRAAIGAGNDAALENNIVAFEIGLKPRRVGLYPV